MNTTSTNTRKIATCVTIVLAGTLVLSACGGGETIKGTEVSSSSSGTAQATERIRDLGFNTKDATVEDSGAWQTHNGQGMTLKVHSSGAWEVRNSQNTKVLDVSYPVRTAIYPSLLTGRTIVPGRKTILRALPSLVLPQNPITRRPKTRHSPSPRWLWGGLKQ